jgi:hypothetical protein
LVTLRDAAQYITKLAKAEHDAEEWQAAMQALLLVTEQDAPPMFCAHRCHAGDKPSRRAGVQPVTKRHALGTAEIEAGCAMHFTTNSQS